MDVFQCNKHWKNVSLVLVDSNQALIYSMVFLSSKYHSGSIRLSPPAWNPLKCSPSILHALYWKLNHIPPSMAPIYSVDVIPFVEFTIALELAAGLRMFCPLWLCSKQWLLRKRLIFEIYKELSICFAPIMCDALVFLLFYFQYIDIFLEL